MNSILFTEVQEALLDMVFRGLPVQTASQRWAGLAIGGNAEVLGGGYARVRMDVLMSAPVSGQTTNTGALSFPTPTLDWAVSEPVTHLLVCEEAQGGNLLAALPFASSVTVRAGDLLEIAPGRLIGSVSRSLSEHWQNALAGLLFRGAAFSSPSRRWIGLARRSGGEVNGAGYARVRLDDKLSVPLQEAGGMTVRNSAVITFPTALGDWSVGDPVVEAVVYDAAELGEVICRVALDNEAAMGEGHSFRFEPGALQLRLLESPA